MRELVNFSIIFFVSILWATKVFFLRTHIDVMIILLQHELGIQSKGRMKIQVTFNYFEAERASYSFHEKRRIRYDNTEMQKRVSIEWQQETLMEEFDYVSLVLLADVLTN